MIHVDGRDGGGQLLRTAVSLAAVTGEAVEVTDVRGGRSNPGIRNQHRTAIEAVAAPTSATVEGNVVGSDRLLFDPDPVTGGEYALDVETAGSVALVFDTVLPLAVCLDDPLSLSVTGGTAVKWAPTLDYFRRVKLPLLARFGLDADATRHRAGFYPKGGGRATLSIRPSSLRTLALTDRGDLETVSVHSVAAASLSDRDVAGRQAAAAREQLEDGGVSAETTAEHVETASPGSALLVRAAYERSLTGFSALGERGKPAEAVAREAVDAFREFHAGAAAVDEQMADQLELWVALAGGAYTAPAVTDHVRSNRTVIEAFGYDLTVSGSDPVEVQCSPGGPRS